MQKRRDLAIKRRVCTRLCIRSASFLILIGFLLINSRLGHGNSSREILSKNSAIYKETISVVSRWKDAVLDRDIEALVAFALSEAQESVRADLKNKDSQLYRLFYGNESNIRKGSRSVYELLRSAKSLKIVLVEHKSLEKLGNGITAYYYDNQTLKPNFPISFKEAQILVEKGDLWTMFFFRAEGRWYTSYEF
jgi:hypothetical protein